MSFLTVSAQRNIYVYIYFFCLVVLFDKKNVAAFHVKIKIWLQFYYILKYPKVFLLCHCMGSFDEDHTTLKEEILKSKYHDFEFHNFHPSQPENG